MSDLTPVAHVALSGGSFYVYEGEDALLALAESDPLAVVVRFNNDEEAVNDRKT
ncbi:MAG: hypothetical protein HOD58_16625 [Gammaproteobacteria bacterium]|jgi:hypothetical protein|nr:hypothetical protein [Gammaproteobacteria bacterium]